MSWPKARVLTSSSVRHSSGATRAIAFTAIAGVGLIASGCGDSSSFRPLYGSSAVGGAGVPEKLAAMEVAPIPGRVGQRIRNEVKFQSTGGGQPLPPEYRLEVVIRESIGSILIDTDADASGGIYNLDASFQLIRLSDKAVLLKGTSYSRAPFERFQSIFSNVRAREDAENRAARTIGDDLKSRLAAYLSAPA